MLPLDHCDLQRHVVVNNLPKVVTPRIELAPMELAVGRPNHYDYRPSRPIS